MRSKMLAMSLGLATLSLTGCETAGVNEGPVEYATRPDYRDVYRRSPPPVRYNPRPPARYMPPPRDDRYNVYRDPYDEPPPPPRRYQRSRDPYRDDDIY